MGRATIEQTYVVRVSKKIIVKEFAMLGLVFISHKFFYKKQCQLSE